MGATVTQKRTLSPGHFLNGKALRTLVEGRLSSNPNFLWTYDYANDYADRETTTSWRTHSDGLPTIEYVQRDPFESFYAYGSWRFDTGHPFRTDKDEVSYSHPKWYARGGNTWYRGPLVPWNYGVYGAQAIDIPSFDSTYWGTKAIRSVVPTNPVSNTLTSLAELKREGIALPGSSFLRALQSRSGFLRSVGSEYLNVEFGWKPLISDLTDVLHAVAFSRILLEQLARDSGKQIRRRIDFPQNILTNSYTVCTTFQEWRPPLAGFGWDALFVSTPSLKKYGSLERVDRVTEDISFSGAFSYYFENGNDPFEKLKGFEQQANHLLGLRLTPEVLWELTPWSWLADWFANFGDLIANVSAFSGDGLVMKYGYLMRHTVSTRNYIQSGIEFQNSNPGPFTITLRKERKERVRATPFGFGLNPSAFSNRQWAILGALGLAKGPKTLP